MTAITENLEGSYLVPSESDGSQLDVDRRRMTHLRRLIQALFVGILVTAGACDQHASDARVKQSSNQSRTTETHNLAGYVEGELVKFVLAGSENNPNAQLCQGKVVRPMFNQNGVLMGYLVERDGIGQDIITPYQIRR